MITDEVDGNERLDKTRVFAHSLCRAPHGGKIAQQRYACEILEKHAGDHEWNFIQPPTCRVPTR
jgi:hypothetical protein